MKKNYIVFCNIVHECYIICSKAIQEHLTFKGVPIDGTLSEYVAKMKSAGFKYLGEQDGTAILQGDFAGV